MGKGVLEKEFMKTNKTIEAGFFYGARPEIFELARTLRKNSTPEEKLLWNEIKGGKVSGRHFRRQHPLNRFIVDFYCHSCRLVIELDGDIHLTSKQKERDEGKDAFMLELGLTVLRFSNKEVNNELKKVLRVIKEKCMV